MKNTNLRCDDMTHCQWCFYCSGLTGAGMQSRWDDFEDNEHDEVVYE